MNTALFDPLSPPRISSLEQRRSGSNGVELIAPNRSCRWRFRSVSVAPSRLVAIGLALATLGCYPAPIRELWPPTRGGWTRPVDVVFWDWHTFVITEESTPDGDRRYHEWEFAETAWYLEGRQGLGGVVRALLWPTASAVRHRVDDEPYWDRHPGREFERWSFVISIEGERRLKEYLESVVGDPLAEHPSWNHGLSSYHLQFLCHHYVLEALRAAGLPVAPWWGYTGWMTAVQLDRTSEYHDEEVLPTRRPAS